MNEIEQECITLSAPHRLKYFRQIIETIARRKDVLFWTGAEIADWFLGETGSGS
jgi:allantoinase